MGPGSKSTHSSLGTEAKIKKKVGKGGDMLAHSSSALFPWCVGLGTRRSGCCDTGRPFASTLVSELGGCAVQTGHP
jgi:hypothetical protein